VDEPESKKSIEIDRQLTLNSVEKAYQKAALSLL
jgi:hypothetical protein